MRLIDADKIENATASDIEVYSFNSVPYIKVEDLLKFINKQPTAYDIDKVVEEIKKQSFIDNELNKVIDLDEAIEVIKAGVKNE